MDLAVEIGDEVGELVAEAGGEVDRAFEGPVEQRGDRLGVAENRAGGAAACVELDPGAGALDVGVVEDLALGQSDGDRGGVGFARAGL